MLEAVTRNVRIQRVVWLLPSLPRIPIIAIFTEVVHTPGEVGEPDHNVSP